MSHDDDAVEQLDRFLDRLTEQPRRGVAPNGLAAEWLQAAEAVHRRDAVDREADPPSEFLARLEDQLVMNASDINLPVFGGPLAIMPDRGRRPPAGVRAIETIVRPLRHPAIGGLATAALLVVALLGVYLSLIAPRGGGGGAPTMPAIAPNASPGAEAAEVPPCDPADPYFGCLYLARPVGFNYVYPPNFDDAARAARQVQLQGWAVMPGATIAGGDASGAASGVVVDIVLSGAYVATFDVPVVVSPGAVTNETIQYLDAGTTVELVRGDSVAYQLGELTELHNPLSVQRLEFKRAVIYEGDISAFSATATGVTTRVEGDGMLPQAIGSYQSEARIELWYMQVLPGGLYPPAQWADDTTIGPVDPQRGPVGTEGFVLVIGRSFG